MEAMAPKTRSPKMVKRKVCLCVGGFVYRAATSFIHIREPPGPDHHSTTKTVMAWHAEGIDANLVASCSGVIVLACMVFVLCAQEVLKFRKFLEPMVDIIRCS